MTKNEVKTLVFTGIGGLGYAIAMVVTALNVIGY